MEKGTRFLPSDSQRSTVRALTGFGHSYREISDYLDVNTDTLQHHFKDELKNGKTELALKCGGRLYDCVLDPNAKDSDRNDAAKYLLTRLCGWTEKNAQDNENTALIIRASVQAAKEAFTLPLVDKDVDKENAGGTLI